MADALWWAVHEPTAQELTPNLMQQYRFNVGNRVGEHARQKFPTGVMAGSHSDFSSWIAKSDELLRSKSNPIFEAAVSASDCFAAIDILEPTNGGWNAIEVKSSLDVKEEHITDVAFQVWVFEQHGIKIKRSEIMLLNRECIFPNLDNLFVRIDISNEVQSAKVGIESIVRKMKAALDSDLPNVAIGDHCDAPYECPFKSRCWPELPAHHISTLYKISTKQQSILNANPEISQIHHLVDQLTLTAIQSRQVDAVKSGEIKIEPSLASSLSALEYPIAYLDFETVMPAIPLWNGCKPYQTIPAQFSCHVEFEDGKTNHHDWLASAKSDPRETIIKPLIQACSGAKTIVAYNAGFERNCINLLAEYAPQFATPLESINQRLFDLLPVVRNNVYHPNFNGGFSIKKVLPALVPELTYNSLLIGEGGSATIHLENHVTFGAVDSSTLNALREYCKFDTLAMVKLKQKLCDLTYQTVRRT